MFQDKLSYAIGYASYHVWLFFRMRQWLPWSLEARLLPWVGVYAHSVDFNDWHTRKTDWRLQQHSPNSKG